MIMRIPPSTHRLSLPGLVALGAMSVLMMSCERFGKTESSAGPEAPSAEAAPTDPMPNETGGEAEADNGVVEATSAEGEPMPAPEAEPEPTPIDTTSKVAILGYHRFSDTPNISRRLLPTTIHIGKFRTQMQLLVDNEIPVISMGDFLAWRRGERNLPPFSVIITLDDGWKSTYDLALPVLKEFSFPFTIYLYTAFLNGGGKTLTFEQIDEMVAAGAEIGSHSVSHQDLRKRGRRSEELHLAYLKEETEGSRRRLQEQLGIDPLTFSYPYGVYNQQVIEACEEARYQAMVTVRGEKVGWETDLRELGRYIIHGEDDRAFNWALSSRLPGGDLATANNLLKETQTDAVTGEARPLVTVQPADGSRTSERRPMFVVDLSAIEDIEPDSLSLQISGLGEVRADYQAEEGLLTYQPTQKLRQPEYWAQVKFQRGGAEDTDVVRWKFSINPIPHYLALAPQQAAPSSEVENPSGADVGNPTPETTTTPSEPALEPGPVSPSQAESLPEPGLNPALSTESPSTATPQPN